MSGHFSDGCALLIGIGNYRNLRKLKKANSDAQRMYDLLSSKCGYSQQHVALLLDEEATKQNINEQLDCLARRAEENNIVVIFFSGHGMQRVGGFEPNEYLCPVDADLHSLSTTAISNEELTTAINAIRASRVIVFLDACHAGGVGEPKEAESKIKGGLSEKSYNLLSRGEGRVVIASCKPNEVSWELGGMQNGLFTHYLLAGLRGESSIAKEGYIRIFDLFDFVAQKITKHLESMDIVQTPLIKAHNVTHNFPIAVVTGDNSIYLTSTNGSHPPTIKKKKLSQPTSASVDDFSNSPMGRALTISYAKSFDESSMDELMRWSASHPISPKIRQEIESLLELLRIQQHNRDRARKAIALVGGEPFATPPQMVALELAEAAIHKHEREIENWLEKAYGRGFTTKFE